jgi:small ligand-binding sensory domain FIST
MARFHLGQGVGEAARALASCLDELGPLPEDANIGFLYVTDPLAPRLQAILEMLKVETGVSDWVGSVGHGICATGNEYFGQPAMAAMVGAVPAGSFTIFDSGVDGGFAGAPAWLEGHAHPFGLVHADPRNSQIPMLIPRLAEVTESFLVGGLSSGSGPFWQIAGGLTQGGISGAWFSEAVPVATGLTQGCVPIGPVHEVTECRDNVIVLLGGRPALDVLKEDIGAALAEDLRQLGGVVFAALPIAGSDRPDYLVRNLVAIDPEEALVTIAAPLVAGQPLMFCRRDPQAAEADLHRMLGDLGRRMGTAPRGAIYVSCLGRGPNMFGPDSVELRIIAEALGDLPLVGFFGNGEISHDRLYTYTGVLTIFL